MADAGDITQSEADAYKKTPITLNINKIPVGCEADQKTAFFCDYVVWSIRNSPEFGPTQTDREALLRKGGLDIYTTMDIKLQRVADNATKTWVPPTDPSKIGAASVSVQVGTGRILALTQFGALRKSRRCTLEKPSRERCACTRLRRGFYVVH